MPFTGSAAISQSADGTELIFTDSSTGITGIISRDLTIYDSDLNLLDDIAMGSSLVAPYDITKDVWLRFIETIVDTNGTHVVTVDFLSTSFFEIAFAPLANKLECCGCEEKCTNLYKALIAKDGSSIFFQRGQSTLAQSNIDGANLFLTENCGC